MRSKLFPLAYQSYREGVEGGDWSKLEEAVKRGREHWESVARQILRVDRAEPNADAALARIGEEAAL
jgi:hypothetical protein